ncbi:MAG: hypothetical protein LC808_11480 [Actinobacteria bacterium]|nr:hypothetical protein [Actinomycetota bacterium]
MMAIRWGLSVLDWHSHAIDERRYHPVGVYKAECGREAVRGMRRAAVRSRQ